MYDMFEIISEVLQSWSDETSYVNRNWNTSPHSIVWPGNNVRINININATRGSQNPSGKKFSSLQVSKKENSQTAAFSVMSLLPLPYNIHKLCFVVKSQS